MFHRNFQTSTSINRKSDHDESGDWYTIYRFVERWKMEISGQKTTQKEGSVQTSNGKCQIVCHLIHASLSELDEWPSGLVGVEQNYRRSGTQVISKRRLGLKTINCKLFSPGVIYLTHKRCRIVPNHIHFWLDHIDNLWQHCSMIEFYKNYENLESRAGCAEICSRSVIWSALKLSNFNVFGSSTMIKIKINWFNWFGVWTLDFGNNWRWNSLY